MTQVLTRQEKDALISSVEEHSTKLAAWLRKKRNVVLKKQTFKYGENIFPSRNDTPPLVGIVMRGAIEVQGPVQSLLNDDEYISYPLALRTVGETIGEIEFVAAKFHGRGSRGEWNAYAGMHTFFLTPLENKYSGPFVTAKRSVNKRSRSYTVDVAWIETNDADSEMEAALNEISVGRLLTIHSKWLPKDKHLKDLYCQVDNGARRTEYRTLIGRGSKSLGDKAIRLYSEVLLALQGSRLGLRPFSESELKEVMPWDNEILRDLRCGKKEKFEDFLILGIHTHKPGTTKPFFIMPQFFVRSLASPLAEHFDQAFNVRYVYRSDLIHASMLADAASEPSDKSSSEEESFLVSNHAVCALISHSGKNSEQNTATSRPRERNICFSGGTDTKMAFKLLSEAVNVLTIKDRADLDKLGLIGNAALVIFPKK